MNRILAPVLFALASTGLELALVVVGVPTLLLVAVGLGLFGTGILLVSWHPLAVVASVGLYLSAVVLGIVDLTLLGVVFSAV